MYTGKVWLDENKEIQCKLDVQVQVDTPWEKFITAENSLRQLSALVVKANILQLQLSIAHAAAIFLDSGDLNNVPETASILTLDGGRHIEAIAFSSSTDPSGKVLYTRPLGWELKEKIEALNLGDAVMLARSHNNIHIDNDLITFYRK